MIKLYFDCCIKTLEIVGNQFCLSPFLINMCHKAGDANNPPCQPTKAQISVAFWVFILSNFMG